MRDRDGRGEPGQRRLAAARSALVQPHSPFTGGTVALPTGSAERMAPVDRQRKRQAGVHKSKLWETRRGGGRWGALSSRRAASKPDYFCKVALPSSGSPHPPTSHDKQVKSHTRARVSIHLLFSRLAVGGNHGSFTFGVHAGFCFKTFAPLNTCQRKQPGKRSISIATPLVFFLPPLFSPSSFSPSPPLSLLPPPPPSSPSLSLSFYISNIGHKSGTVSTGGT